MTDAEAYRHLLSPLRIRNTTLPNRVIFAPVCPTWVRSPHEGIFTEQAVAYYEERAKTGLGMIILGGHLINKDTIYTPLGFPGLWNDAQLEGLANVARAVKRHGCALSVQLLHLGLRSPTPFLKTDPARDPDEYNPYMLAPSQVPAGEIPGGPTPKELEEHEIEYILQCYEDAARRAISAGLDGIEFHIAHGYLPWQFLSPFYNKRTDRWGGSYENRLRFSIEAMRRIRKRIGDRPFIGYRINSTSFWDGDLEIEDIKRIHADFEKELDIDYVSVSAGVHHSWIHTPMTFEQGWEREYTRAIKTVAKKPVLLVGRVSHPGVADELLGSGDADAILLARQMIADEQWMTKVKEGRVNDIRRCVAANYCWRAVIRGSRVQCAYNPVVGRERVWGASSMRKVAAPRRALVIGAGPAGLEYARVAAARGNHVVVYEREPEVGGHVRAYGALPNRTQYGTIATWLAEQARGNGAVIKTGNAITAENLDAVLSAEQPDHVVVATGARYRRDGFQGQTAEAAARMGKRPLRHLGRSGARQDHRFRRRAGDRRNGRCGGAAHGRQTGAARRQSETSHQMADDRLGDDGGGLSPLGADLSLRGRGGDHHRSCRQADQRQRGRDRQHLRAVQNAPDHGRHDRDGDGARIGKCALPSPARARPQRRGDRLRDCAAHRLRGDARRSSRGAQARRPAVKQDGAREPEKPGAGLTGRQRLHPLRPE